MWRIRENEFVCISAFFNKEKHYPYGAKATRPSTVIRITQKEFTKVIYRHPELRIILTDLLCSRITSRQNLTEISLKLSPKQRIIHFLIANSKPTSDNGIPEMDFNTSNFAAQIYTTPKLVNRVLHKLMDNNLVDIKGDRLMILDLTGLTRILNMKVIMDSL
jgi:CRP-like cAMP-binding protein